MSNPYDATIVAPLPFRQQIPEYLIKFEILTLAFFFILKFSIGNGYTK
jgi:hypothetical protein